MEVGLRGETCIAINIRTWRIDMSKEIFGMIKYLVDTLEDNNLKRLNLEEFLMNKVIESGKASRELRVEAIRHKGMLNQMQNEILGQNCNGISSKFPNRG